MGKLEKPKHMEDPLFRQRMGESLLARYEAVKDGDSCAQLALTWGLPEVAVEIYTLAGMAEQANIVAVCFGLKSKSTVDNESQPATAPAAAPTKALDDMLPGLIMEDGTLEEVIDVAELSEEELNGKSMLEKANYYMGRGDKNKAKSYLNKAVRLFERDEQYQEAVLAAEEANYSFPNLRPLYAKLVDECIENGQLDVARVYAEKGNLIARLRKIQALLAKPKAKALPATEDREKKIRTARDLLAKGHPMEAFSLVERYSLEEIRREICEGGIKYYEERQVYSLAASLAKKLGNADETRRLGELDSQEQAFQQSELENYLSLGPKEK